LLAVALAVQAVLVAGAVLVDSEPLQDCLLQQAQLTQLPWAAAVQDNTNSKVSMVLILYLVLSHLQVVALADQILVRLLKLARQVDREAVLVVTVLLLAARLHLLVKVVLAVAVLEAI
jgi:hypothetical protein